MSVSNYESSREHFLRFGSKLPEAEKKKYEFFEPKESEFLKARLSLIGDSLQGLIIQQEAARQYRQGITSTQKRDVIHLETHKDTALLPNYTRYEEKRTAGRLYREKSIIETQTNADEFSALRLLNMEEDIKKEVKHKEEEKKTAANQDAIAAIDREIAELNAFLAQLPKMREAIQEFTQQQILRQLSASSIARAAMEEVVPLGESSDGKINEGEAYSEKQKKDWETTIIRVSGRFASGTLALTVKENYDAAGNKELDLSIPNSCFERGKYGLPGFGYLYHEGRVDLAEAVHERLRKAMKQDFGMDFLSLDPANFGWFMYYLAESIEVSLEEAKRQAELSKIDPNSPPLSAHVIMHDAAIASLEKWVEKNPYMAWFLKKDILAIKRLNNVCNIEKANLLIDETDHARQTAGIYNPSSTLIATKNMTTALQQLARAARQEIAVALSEVEQMDIHDGIDVAAQALVSLRQTQNSIQAEYDKALAGYEQVQVQLDHLKAEERRPGAKKTKEIQNLETQVIQLKGDVEKLAVALTKIKEVVQEFHVQFEGTNAADRITAKEFTALADKLTVAEKQRILAVFGAVNFQLEDPPVLPRPADLTDFDSPAKAEKLFEVALAHEPPFNNLRQTIKDIYTARMGATPIFRNREQAITALAPIVRMDADSARAIATIIVDARRPPVAVADRAAAIDAQLRLVQTPAQTVNKIKEAFNVNANDTMAVLHAVYELVTDPAADPETIAAMMNTVPAEIERLVRAFPQYFVALVRRNPDRLRAIIAAHPASFVALVRAHPDTLRAMIAANPASFVELVRAHPETLRAMIAASPASFVELVRAYPETLRAMIAASPENFVELVCAHPDTLRAMIAASPASFIELVRNVPEILTGIIRTNPASFIGLVRAHPETLRAILECNTESFIELARTNPDCLRTILEVDTESFIELARRNPATLQAIIAASPKSFIELARRNSATLQTIIATSPGSFVELVRTYPDTLRAMITASPASFVELVRNDEATLRQIIKASPLSFVALARNNPVVFRAIIAASPESFARILMADARMLNMIAGILAGVNPTSRDPEEIERLNVARERIRGNPTAEIMAVYGRLGEPLHTQVSVEPFKNVPLEVSQELNRSGLAFVDIPGGGNCLYDAIARQVKREDQQALREAVANELTSHPDRYAALGLPQENPALEEYIAGIRNGEWGDNLTLEALMHLNNKPIIVINRQNGEILNPQDAIRFTGDPIFVAHNGLGGDSAHYDALDVDENMSGRSVLARLNFSQAIRAKVEAAQDGQIGMGIRVAIFENEDALTATVNEVKAVGDAANTSILHARRSNNNAREIFDNRVEAVGVDATASILDARNTEEARDVFNNRIETIAAAGDGVDVLILQVVEENDDAFEALNAHVQAVAADEENNDADVFILRAVEESDDAFDALNDRLQNIAAEGNGADAFILHSVENNDDAFDALNVHVQAVAEEGNGADASILGAVNDNRNAFNELDGYVRRVARNGDGADVSILDAVENNENALNILNGHVLGVAAAGNGANASIINARGVEAARTAFDNRVITVGADADQSIINARGVEAARNAFDNRVITVGADADVSIINARGMEAARTAFDDRVIAVDADADASIVNAFRAEENVRIQVVEEVQNAAPEDRQPAIAVTIRNHHVDPVVQTAISNTLVIADPLVVASNASIDALAPLVLANEDAKTLLANILVDARIPPVAANERVITFYEELQMINHDPHNLLEAPLGFQRAPGSVAAIQSALAHNRVAGLEVLRMMHDKLVDPKADSALLARFVNGLNIPALRDTIVVLLPEAPANRALGAEITVDQLQEARTHKPAEFNAIMENMFAIANPTAVAEALDSDPVIKAESQRGATACAQKVMETGAEVEVDPAAKRLSEVQENADNTAALMNPKAAIASRKVVIGALTNIVLAPTAEPRDEAQELARVDVIRQMDVEVLAEWVAKSSDAQKNSIADCVPVGAVPPAIAVDRQTVLRMLNDPLQAKNALEAAFTINPQADVNAEALRCRNAGNAMRDILIHAAPNKHVAMERALGADPVGILARTRAAHNVAVTVDITSEVQRLSAADIREIAKVDLALGALILSSVVLTDPNPRTGLDQLAIAEIAKWVPNPPAVNIAVAKEQLRDAENAGTALRAAFIAHPVEAQKAMNAAMNLVTDAQLVAVRNPVNEHIGDNPYAAIDTHPLVIKARNNFVKNVPSVVAAQAALNETRARIRQDVIQRSKDPQYRAAVKDAAIATLARDASIRALAQTMVQNNELLQAVGKHIPILLNVSWSGKPRSANVEETITQLRKIDPERWVEIFTDPAVFNQLAPFLNDDHGLALAINNYIADDDRSVDAAVERNTEVIQARVKLETERHDAVAADLENYNNDSGVKKARVQVVKGAKESLVQDKLYEHLILGKKFTGKPAVGVVQTLEFLPEGSAAGEPPIVVNADAVRDTVLQLMQDEVKYFTDLAARQERLLNHSEKCEAKTANAENSLGPNIEAKKDLESVLKVLEKVALTDKEQERVTRAENLLKALRSPKDPVGRLFDNSVLADAKQKVGDTANEVTRLKGELELLRENKPAALRAIGNAPNGVVGAAQEAAIPVGLITDDAILAQRVPDRAVGTDIQKARAQDYINLINADKKINDLRKAGEQNMEAAIRCEIPKAKLRILNAELKEIRADVLNDQARVILGGGRVSIQEDLQNILAVAVAADPTMKPNQIRDSALDILQTMANTGAPPRGANIRLNQNRAIELLSAIDNDPRVRQKLNETLDTQRHSKAAWEQVVKNDVDVKAKVQAVATAESKAGKAVTSHDKMVSQFESKKEATRNLNVGRNAVKKRNQHEAAKHTTVIEAREQRAVELQKAHDAKITTVGRAMGYR